MRRTPQSFLFVLLCMGCMAIYAAAPSPAQKKVDLDDENEVVMPQNLDRLTIALDPGGHTAVVTRAFFTPDSKQIVTVSGDHSVRIWDAQTGETVQVLHPPGFGGLAAADLSQDGKTLAVSSRYAEGGKVHHVVYLIALADGHVVRVLKGHPQAIEAIAFSADGKRLASTSAGKEGTVLVWNLEKETPERAFRFIGSSSYIYRAIKRGLAFSPDGTRLARVRLSGGPGDILDLRSGKPVGKLPGMTVAWSPDGKTLATTLSEVDGKGVQLWNADGTERLRLTGIDGGCHSVTFSADSRTLLATWGRADFEESGIFDVASGKLLVKSDAKSARHGSLSPDGKLAVTTVNRGSGVHGITVWKTGDGKVAQLASLVPTVIKLSKRTGWSADGQAITWPSHRTGQGFNLANLEITPALKDFQGPVFQQGTLSVEKNKLVKNGTTLATLKGHGGTLFGTARAASVHLGVIYLYDTATGKETHSLHGHLDEVNEVVPSADGRFLLSTSVDQTLRIWTADGTRPLLSLFVKGRDWVVWTEQGYYAATPGGERLIGWKVDNGMDKAVSFFPTDRFRKRLYRPDVIKLVLEKGGVVQAVAAADAARGSETRSVKVEEMLPPRVVRSVADDSKLPTVRLKVQAEAAVKSQPITSLRLLMDGRPVQGKDAIHEFKDGQAQATVEFVVEVPAGEHQLAVLVRSEDSSSVSKPVRIKHIEAKKLPTLYVLTVGVNEYKDSSLDLKFAAADAESLAAGFAKNCKDAFSDIKTRTLLNKQATGESILREIKDMRKQVNQQDLVIVFFACHGVKQKSQYFLLTHETSLDDLAGSALSGAKLKDALGDFKCQVLLMLDACHSAGFGTGKKLTQMGLKPATDDVTRDLTEDDYAVAVMCAAMSHEKAEGRDGHGLFTRGILDALEKKPGVPFNPFNQRIYVHHLQAYVFDHVSHHSEERQHPCLNMPWIVESFVVR